MTITAGNAVAPDQCSEPHSGGGVFAVESVIAIADCKLSANRAARLGGGLYAGSGQVQIWRSEFSGNQLTIFSLACQWPCDGVFAAGGGVSANHAYIGDTTFIQNYGQCGHGGGAAVGAGSVIERCTFIGNAANWGGAALLTSATLIDSVFQSNGAGQYGGAIRNTGVSTAINCRFLANYATDCGGAVYSPGASITLINCLLRSNFASSNGAAINAGWLSLINCTVVANGFGNPAIVTGLSFTALNSILWGNGSSAATDVQTQQISLPPSANPQIHNSCIQGWTGQWGGTGNHGNNPSFADPANGDYRLRANSPAIDGGDNDALPADEFDLDEDGDTSESIPFDLDGLTRIVNKVVDVGAFEFQAAPCRADINGDELVNVDDLLALLFAWGQCAPLQSCDADLNLEGLVNVDDLLELLQGWGACP